MDRQRSFAWVFWLLTKGNHVESRHSLFRAPPKVSSHATVRTLADDPSKALHASKSFLHSDEPNAITTNGRREWIARYGH